MSCLICFIQVIFFLLYAYSQEAKQKRQTNTPTQENNLCSYISIHTFGRNVIPSFDGARSLCSENNKQLASISSWQRYREISPVIRYFFSRNRNDVHSCQTVTNKVCIFPFSISDSTYTTCTFHGLSSTERGRGPRCAIKANNKYFLEKCDIQRCFDKESLFVHLVYDRDMRSPVWGDGKTLNYNIPSYQNGFISESKPCGVFLFSLKTSRLYLQGTTCSENDKRLTNIVGALCLTEDSCSVSTSRETITTVPTIVFSEKTTQVISVATIITSIVDKTSNTTTNKSNMLDPYLVIVSFCLTVASGLIYFFVRKKEKRPAPYVKTKVEFYTPPKIPTTYENPFVLNESVTFAKVFENDEDAEDNQSIQSAQSQILIE